MADTNQQNWQDPKPASFPPPAGPSQPTPAPFTPQSFSSGPAPAQPQYTQPKPPPPPPPEITIRTMKSDLESLKETGGAPPSPKPFTPPELKKEYQPPTLPAQPAAPAPPKIAPADFGQPQKMEAPKPMAPAPAATPIIEEESNRGSRKMFVWGASLATVIGVGLLGYFILFPMLFPAQTPPPAPAITTPTTEQSTTPEIPGEITPPAAEPLIHQSLLTSDGLATIQLPTVDRTALMAALQQEAQKPNPAGTLIEIGMNDLSGQFPAGNLFAMLLPSEAETLGAVFESDFTAALYHDADGAWPVYVFKLHLESSIVEAQTAIQSLENSQALQNFFLSDPGTPNAAGFRDGQVNGLQTRYLTYDKRGAALNFAWSGDRAVISTSYNGLRKALTNLK